MVGCSAEPDLNTTPIAQATETPELTATPLPTSTLRGTSTPLPTETPTPQPELPEDRELQDRLKKFADDASCDIVRTEPAS